MASARRVMARSTIPRRWLTFGRTLIICHLGWCCLYSGLPFVASPACLHHDTQLNRLTSLTPCSFEWTTCDVNDQAQLKEIYELLSLHYVEDEDEMFRFAYSKEFLHWALQPPGYREEWHCGVRVRCARMQQMSSLCIWVGWGGVGGRHV
jgi:hypothetical protein